MLIGADKESKYLAFDHNFIRTPVEGITIMEYYKVTYRHLFQEVWERLPKALVGWKLKGDKARPAQTRSEPRADLRPTSLPRPKSS